MAHRVLEVTLLSAKDLKNVNLITRMEVYAVATISGDPITRQCTPPDPHGGRHPTWNATLRFAVPATAEEARGGCLHILLRAERMFGGDRDVGEVIVPLAEILTGGGLGAPSSPQFASYQVCKVHRSETHGLLYLTYRLGPVVPPPPHAKQADGGAVVGYPAPQVMPSSPAAKPAGHEDGLFSPAKPAAGYVDVLPSPKPYGYGTAPWKQEGHVAMPPSAKPTDQVVSMTTSPKPVGRVVSMPPSTKPVEHVVSMPPSPKPAGRSVSMPSSPRLTGHEVPMPPSPKSAGGQASSPKSAGGYVSSHLKPSVHTMPTSPKPDTSMAMRSSPKPAGHEVPMPPSPRSPGGHVSPLKPPGGHVLSSLKPDTSMAVPSSPKPAGGHNIAMPSSPKPFGGHASVPPSPTPYGQAVGERIFTKTDVYRCPIIQPGAATSPN